MVKKLAWLACGWLLFCSGSFCQSEQANSPDTLPVEKIKSESIRVTVPITVESAGDESVIGLKREDFRLYVDDVEVKEFQFLHNADLPVSMGVVFDHSSHVVMSHFSWMKLVVRGLIHEFNPEDEFFLATYGYEYAEVQPTTSDRIAIMETLQNLHPYMFGSRESFWSFFKTSVRDWSKQLKSDPPNKTAIALDRSLYSLNLSEHPKKILLLLSDGDENLSNVTLNHIQHYGIPCYFIYFKGTGVGERSLFRRGAILETISRETGGRILTDDGTTDPSVIGQRIAAWVRNQYLIGFEPSPDLARDKTHTIRIEVKLPAAQLYYRKSFRFMKE
jgi:VWFA-related protein